MSAALPSLDPLRAAIRAAGFALVSRAAAQAGVILERSEQEPWRAFVEARALSFEQACAAAESIGLEAASAAEQALCDSMADRLEEALSAQGWTLRRCPNRAFADVTLKSDTRQALERRAAAPTRARRPQEFDCGALPLFGDSAGQTEMF